MSKQIIIDGLSCDNCPEFKRCQEQQTKKEYAINQFLQDIPSEYANIIDRLKQIIPSITRCDYVLEKQLKRKEQECNKLYIQLKADEEYHKEEENTLRKIIKNKEERNIELYKENNNLKQTLTEIKKIAEILSLMTDEYENCYDRDRCFECDCTEDCSYFNTKQIIQICDEAINE